MNFKELMESSIDGHSSNFSNPNFKTFQSAGNGAYVKKNQGKGEEGRKQMVPSHGIDTTRLSKRDKAMFLKSRGYSVKEPEITHETPPVESKQSKMDNAIEQLSALSGINTVEFEPIKSSNESEKLMKQIIIDVQNALSEFKKSNGKMGTMNNVVKSAIYKTLSNM